MGLENKVVLITGAGFPNGIGAGIARCFSEEGAKVIILDLEGAPVIETAAAIPGDVTGLIADASSQESMGKVVAQVIDTHGRIDVLVNNAGVAGPNLETDVPSGNLLDPAMTDELWDTLLAANLRTTFASSSAVIPKMADGGSIVNMASIGALMPTPELPAYGAAKSAVIHLTKTHAVQLAHRRIRVNCICPGLLWTRAWDILTAEMKKNNPDLADVPQRDLFKGMVSQQVPFGEEQTPEDIGDLAVFLSSDKARMITGAVVAVAGGMDL